MQESTARMMELLHQDKQTLIMGILNVTPDSFSDGGRHNTVEQAVRHARKLIEEGADILDIGGESTRPGARLVPAEEELERIIPVIEALRKESDIPISVDTYKAGVARQSLAEGADIINDIWGFKKDPAMAATAAEFACPVILMHNRETEHYADFLFDVLTDLKESVQIALRSGVKPENIILDPGIGFAKSYEQNLLLMNNLRELKNLGYPVLLGTSRKRMIRWALDLPVEDVVEGTMATTVLGIAQGCRIIRVHDVLQNKRAAVMSDAIVEKPRRVT